MQARCWFNGCLRARTPKFRPALMRAVALQRMCSGPSQERSLFLRRMCAEELLAPIGQLPVRKVVVVIPHGGVRAKDLFFCGPRRFDLASDQQPW